MGIAQYKQKELYRERFELTTNPIQITTATPFIFLTSHFLSFLSLTTCYNPYYRLNLKFMDKQREGEGESNILVAIRVRPLNQKQQNSGDWDVIRIQQNLIIILDPIEKQFQNENRKMLEVYHRSKEQRYAFDRIYRNQTSEEIYVQTVKPLIRTVLSGKNATVFAYGPTGTGKTFTMLGNQDCYGLNVLAIADIFKLIEADPDFEYTVIINYVEIYNEMIRDLLVPTSGYLQLRDDSQRGITIAGVTECKAESTEQVMGLLLAGNKRRTTQATNANLTSSRSHAVFQINIAKKSRVRAINVETLTGKLSLIDLAGSERGTVTENRGLRLMQGAKINRSLLALANCINALGDKNKKGFFVPYRDSKLTRLLKDSLGGNCKTVMISNISPASSQFEETINSLKYANRAKNIKTKAITNKELVSIHISEYKNIINDLRQEIQQLKQRLQTKGQNQSEIVPPQPIHSGHAFVRKEGQVCHCGRIEQGQEIKRIKEHIFENFNERIQLRRILMEIQEQNSQNYAEIRRKMNEISQLRDVPQLSEDFSHAQQEIRSLSKLVYTLKLNSKKNLLKKEITSLQLQQSLENTRKIRQEMNRRIRTKENRDFLQIIIKNHILELQNIELEINLQLQEKLIASLHSVSQQQKNIIDENHLALAIQDNDSPENEDNIELEIEEEEEGEPVEEEEEEDNAESESNEKKRRNKSSQKAIKNGFEEEEAKQPTKKNKELKIPPISKPQSKNTENKPNELQFNLKGFNLKLEQKLPFSLNKDKKKK